MYQRGRTGTDEVEHVVTANRQMLEKALLMRAHSYLSDVKAQLLTGVIFEIDSSRKRLLTAHQRLKEALHTVSLQKELLELEVNQRMESEQSAHGARLQAEVANRTRAQFLANISHDVLTPLNAINAYAEMIDNEILGPLVPAGYKSYAADIHRASGHLHDLILSLLETTRVEAGELQITTSDIDLVELLRDALAMVDHQATQKGITVRDGVALKVLPINADPILLRRLILNLATNALKFTEPGGQIGVSVEAGDDGGAVLRFTDTGQGIAPEDIETALTPYGQIGAGSGKAGEHNRQAANGSFGLGLPMAKAIAEAHGGSLSIESKVGTGTTVTLNLPG